MTGVQTCALPIFGYFVLRSQESVAERLALNEALSCRVTRALSLPVEAFAVTRLAPRTSRESINPEQALRAEIRAKTIDVPAGSLYVPMTQPAAGIVAAALEPDSAGSYLGAGAIAFGTDETEAPVYRLMQGAAAPCTP